MSLTKTPICDFGKKAENFQLKSTENKIFSLNDIKGENGTLIMFICNHCPYVKAVIKDIVNGTIERKELIQNLMYKELKDDINENKTELMIKLMIMAGIYEFMFMHKTPINVVISEYLKVADFFVQKSQKSFLNAILEKISKVSRVKKG